MKIKVEVVHPDGPFLPGTAIVSIDGAVYARLRSDESIEIVVKQDLQALVDQPTYDEAMARRRAS